MGSVHIRLLGRFELTTGDETFGTERFERRAGAELVQFLAATADRRRHRDEIFEALWPEASPDAAKKRLYKATTLARKALGHADSIVVQRDTVSLWPDAEVRVDVVEFERAAADDETDRALELYGGEFLLDDPYTEWTMPIRRRLADRYTNLLRKAERWHTLVENSPSDEAAQVELMRESFEAGDHAAVLRRWEELVGALDDELGVTPGPDASQLREAALEANLPSLDRDTAPWLIDLEPIVGRDDDVKAVIERLADHRAVTIVGAGGSGKTSVARHVAAHLAELSDAVWFCELGRLRPDSLVDEAILQTVGGTGSASSDALAATAQQISHRAGVLVLDNCEHVLESVRAAISSLRASCPELRFLCTSRAPVGVRLEAVLPLGELGRIASAKLFTDEARRLGAEVDPDSPAIERICERLDHLPLALQLAAARARSVGVEGVERLLDDRLDALRTDEEVVSDHHRSLREAISWSFDSLSDAERRVLATVSVFADRFTVDGVVAVAAESPTNAGATLDHFDRLVRSSLVVGPTPGPQTTTYRLLESVRVFAREHLEDDVRDRHLSYVLERARTSRSLIRKDPDESMARYGFDYDDVAVARQFALVNGRREQAIRLLADTAFVAHYMIERDFLDWYDQAVDGDRTTITSVDQARAAGCAALMLSYRGDFDESLELAGAALEVAPDDDLVLWAHGYIRRYLGIDEFGRASFAQIVADRTGTNGPLRSGALLTLVVHDAQEGRMDLIDEHLERLGALAGLGEVYRLNHIISSAFAEYARGNSTDARALAEESIDLAESLRHRSTAIGARDLHSLIVTRSGTDAEVLETLLATLDGPLRRGSLTHAVIPLSVASHGLIRFGEHQCATLILAASITEIKTHFAASARKTAIATLRQQEPDRFETWWAAGKALDFSEAVDIAIDKIEALSSTLES